MNTSYKEITSCETPTALLPFFSYEGWSACLIFFPVICIKKNPTNPKSKPTLQFPLNVSQ